MWGLGFGGRFEELGGVCGVEVLEGVFRRWEVFAGLVSSMVGGFLSRVLVFW